MIKSASGLFVLLIVLLLAMGCEAKTQAPPASPSDTLSPPSNLEQEPTASEDNTTPASEFQDPALLELRTGYYVGLIDSNSVEIEVDGYPKPTAARAFQLSDDLKENWDSLDFQEGDKVTITFDNTTQPATLTEIIK
ncbi:MAG: hypothetical protein LBR98_03880 [Syntrophomonadaceae bacterium]|nr:hypothetical protein [Syntrophomonadaceae bacterium]